MSSDNQTRDRRPVVSKPVGAVATEVPIQKAPEPPSKLPEVLKFPLVLALSISIAELLYPLDAEFNRNALLDFSRPTFENEIVPVVAVGLWKVLELSLGWFGGLDDIDMLSFTLLTHIPHAYFLRIFYFLPIQPIFIGLFTTILANVAPFYLLRRRNTHNNPDPTHALTKDPQIAHITALVATSMYAIPVVASMTSWLPTHLATYFYGLRTLEPAQTAVFWSMLLTLFPIGYAARNFIFHPLANTSSITLVNKATAAYSSGKRVEVLEFDPETATLFQTVHRNVAWWTYLQPRTQIWVSRTMLLTSWIVANTAFKAFMEVEGAELPGALGWSSVWGLGTLMASGVLGWIAGVQV